MSRRPSDAARTRRVCAAVLHGSVGLAGLAVAAMGCGVPDVSFTSDASTDAPVSGSDDGSSADASPPPPVDGGGSAADAASGAETGSDASAVDAADDAASADAGVCSGGVVPPGFNVCCKGIPCGGMCTPSDCSSCENCSAAGVCCKKGSNLSCHASGPCP